MSTAAVEPQTLTPDEIRALPAVGAAQPTVCAVWGIAPATYFRLLAEGELPVPTFTVGRRRKVLRAEILRALGISETTSNGAGAATPTPLAEAHDSTV